MVRTEAWKVCTGIERKLGNVDGGCVGAAVMVEKLHAQATGAKVDARHGAMEACTADLAASCRTNRPVQRCIVLIMYTCSMQHECHAHCCSRRQHSRQV